MDFNEIVNEVLALPEDQVNTKCEELLGRLETEEVTNLNFGDNNKKVVAAFLSGMYRINNEK
jgi:hypothetical protein